MKLSREPNIVLVVTRPVTRMSRASIVIHRQIPDGSQIDALPTSVGKGKKFDIMQYFIKGDNDPKLLFLLSDTGSPSHESLTADGA